MTSSVASFTFSAHMKRDMNRAVALVYMHLHDESMRVCYRSCVRHRAATVSYASTDVVQLCLECDVACCVLDSRDHI